MFYDDSPFSTLINVGMWGFSAFVGYKRGEANALKIMEDRQKEIEIQALRRQVEELTRMVKK
jgi:hypothetical protein